MAVSTLRHTGLRVVWYVENISTKPIQTDRGAPQSPSHRPVLQMEAGREHADTALAEGQRWAPDHGLEGDHLIKS